MKKGSMTILVPNNTTQDELKKIRDKFNTGEHAKDYRLNIIISGQGNHIENLGSFLKAWQIK